MTIKRLDRFVFLGLYLWKIPMVIESATTQPNSLLLLLRFSSITFFMCINLSILVLLYLTSNKLLVIGFPWLMFVLNQIEEIEDDKDNTCPIVNVEYSEFMMFGVPFFNNGTIWPSGLRHWILVTIWKAWVKVP